MPEKAAEQDAPLHMTEVNHAEIKSPVLRQDGAARWEQIVRDLPTLPIEFLPADRELADLAADFKLRVSLSLADAFAAALAKRHKAELVTGDPEFKAGISPGPRITSPATCPLKTSSPCIELYRSLGHTLLPRGCPCSHGACGKPLF